MSLEQLESAVSDLPREELTKFSRWFEEFMADQWDRQIEEDVRNGKLEAAYQQLQRENQGQADIPLDEVLDDGKLSQKV